ncbi:MAG: hypothetical protein KAG97_07135 [Victivallales bacterium]|nr:hypothetical protein [Victivallales bacterium]
MIDATISGMALSVTDFGAVGDGATNDAAAIQITIDAATEKGGGTVVFPTGRYLTGTIKLRDNLTIILMKGAVVVASPNINDYEEDLGVNPASGQRRYLFEGRDVKNLSLRGEGEIRGNGPAYWEEHPSPLAKVKLAKKNRPTLIYLIGCERILIQGISIFDAPAYTIWLLGCREVRIEGLLVRNPRFGPNTDILDIDCCSGVMINNCNLEAGDDCIALKSDAARVGRKIPCENIVVENCILSSTTTGVRIGWEADEPIRDCVFNGLVIHNTRTALDVLSLVPECSFTTIEKGTPIENVIFSNIVMRDVKRAIHVWAGGSQPEHEYDAFVRGLSFCGIRAKTRSSIFIGSVADTTCVSDILLRDVFIEQIADEYDGGDEIVEFPVNCWGSGHLPNSVNLRKIDGITLDNVKVERGEALSKQFDAFQWSDIRDGMLNGVKMDVSGVL